MNGGKSKGTSKKDTKASKKDILAPIVEEAEELSYTVISSRFNSCAGIIRRFGAKAPSELDEKQKALLNKANAFMADEALMKRHKEGKEARRILAAKENEVFLEKKKKREEREKRRLDRSKKSVESTTSSGPSSASSSSKKESQKKDKMPASDSKQDLKKDTKPSSSSAKTKREDFQKRGRSDDSHEKKGSKAVKTDDGTRLEPSISGQPSKMEVKPKDPGGFELVVVDDNNKIDGQVSRETWMKAEEMILRHTTYTPEAPAIGLLSKSWKKGYKFLTFRRKESKEYIKNFLATLEIDELLCFKFCCFGVCSRLLFHGCQFLRWSSEKRIK